MNKSRGLALVLGVVLILFAGIFAGQVLQARLANTPGPEPAKQTGLLVGDPFPSVELATADGTPVDTDALIQNGSVILFLDPVCDSCGPLGERWQRAIERGDIPLERVFGIVLRDADVESYRADKGLQFPIFQDAGREFRQNWNVNWVPYEVIVGQSGDIQSTRSGTEEDWNLRKLRQLLDS